MDKKSFGVCKQQDIGEKQQNLAQQQHNNRANSAKLKKLKQAQENKHLTPLNQPIVISSYRGFSLYFGFQRLVTLS